MDKRQLITSAQNPKIKAALSLRDKRERGKTGLFLIEGYRELKRAVDAGIHIESCLFCSEFFLKHNEETLLQQIPAPLYQLPPPLFEKLSYRDRPDGLLAVAYQMKTTLSQLVFKKGKPPFLIVAESIEKPGNLGTILRSADAAGVEGVIVVDPCTDIYNPNVVRSSVGTLFTLPVIEAKGEEVLAFLKRHQIQIVAATPSASSLFTQVDLRGPVALLVGTEQLGLSSFWMDRADIQVKIPMHGVADSLNVASATTLLLYEVVRQRV